MLRRHTRANARLLAARVKRLHDATHTLAAAIGAALDAAPAQPESLRMLAAAGFARDGSGFYERTQLLARARAGDPPDGEGLCFVSVDDERLPEVAPRIVSMMRAGPAFWALQQRLGDVAWVYYTDRSGMGLGVPYRAPDTVLSREFNWLGYLPYLIASPGANPSRDIVWTPPNVDYGGRGVILTPSLPVYRGDQFEGVVHIDVPMQSLVDDALREQIIETQVSFIVDGAGLIVAHPTVEGVLRGEHGAIARESIRTLGPGLGELDVRVMLAAGSSTCEVMTRDGAAMVVAEAVPEIGWLLVSVFPTHSLVAQRMQQVRAALAALSRGDTSVRVAETSDVVGEIARAFNDTAGALQVTERARSVAFAELERSRAELRAMFDASPSGMVLFDGDDRVVEENRACKALRPVLSPLPPMLAQLLATARRTGAAGPFELEMQTVEHGPRLVRVYVRSLVRDGGTMVLCSAEDLTDRRAIESRLVEAEKMRVVGRLAAGVAHDFNNLLTAIGTSVHLLRSRTDGDDARELLATITEATDRAGALTSQLLAFSRNQPVDSRVHELRTVLRDAWRLVRRVISSDIELVLDLDDDLPLVRIDNGQLTQVLLNLVVNARDALPGSGGRIDVKARRLQNGAEIRVEDDGRGMDRATLARASEPFFTTKSTGTGLGLSTVKNIVTAAGGTLTLTSQIGVGTTVVVTLPAAQRTATVPETVARTVASAEAVIVLVDDDALVLNSTARGLRHLGYTVREFSSSEEAAGVLADVSQPVSVLLTDVVMAGKNGRELAEVALQARPELPVIFMSGYQDDAILTHGIESNTVRLVRKPFSPEALAEALAEAL
ncbi:MAG: ATP-binding protein [Kofleriaceae bacterium]|nr:ATP-binding protein [Kofleriaceae bacterium]